MAEPKILADIASIEGELGTIGTNVASVKTDTTGIKTDTTNIKTDTTTLLSRIPAGGVGGVNWKEYKNYNFATGTTPVQLTSSYATLLNINGTGYLNMLVVTGSSSSDSKRNIRVTMDGQVIYQVTNQFPHENHFIGLDRIFFGTAEGNFLYQTSVFNLPVNVTIGATAYPVNVPLAQPLFFNTNLKVEVQGNGGTTGHSRVFFIGATKI